MEETIDITRKAQEEIGNKVDEIIDIMNFYGLKNNDCMVLAALAAVLMTQPPKILWRRYLDEMRYYMCGVLQRLDKEPGFHKQFCRDIIKDGKENEQE